MKRITVVSISCILFNLNTVSSFTYMGNKESLRKNIEELRSGTLQFSDDSIPSYKEELLDNNRPNGSEYDFIIIGAGSAGSAIASRLSEVKNITVLLLEAGGKEYPIMNIPAMSESLRTEQINWNYQTEPSDKYCVGMENSSCKIPRGKVMGGSSVLNYMLATRGNRRDFDEWAQISGDQGWSYQELLKYFKKLENFQVNGVQDNEFHNKKGPIPITEFSYRTRFYDSFIEASKEMKFPQADYNGKEQIGYSFSQNTVKDGERWSSNRAYLHPIKNRNNLFLSRNSLVNKVLIDYKTKAAYAVGYTKFNKNIIAKARKEIILCAGAINSPQILMLSGIGPAKHLQNFKIEVIKDAPVGENLMDHVMYTGLMFKVNDSKTYKELSLLDPKNSAIKDYLEKRNGPLSTSNLEAVLYMNVDSQNPMDTDPNIELIFSGTAGLMNSDVSTSYGIADKYRRKMLADKFNHSSWIAWPMLMKPKSRGKLLLTNKNPTAKPRILANYFDHKDDIRIMIKGVRNAIKLSKTRAFQKYGSALYDIPLPCENLQKNSDAYWECAVRTYSSTVHHFSGTCKMGRENDKTSVVNSKLQVIGIIGLRIGDASIMPMITSAHIHLPTVVIGEKLADMIKSDWKLKQ